MLPVGGRPILEHLLELLRHHGVTDVAINLHYRPEAIVDYFGDGHSLGMRITYSHEERLLGSAGAAKQLQAFLDETFVVIYGDVLATVDLTELARVHAANRAAATLALYEVDEPGRCGIVQLDALGRVRRFVEKPSPAQRMGNLANSGIYVLDPSVLDHVPPGEPFDFGYDLFPRLLAAGQPLFGHVSQGYILDMGSPERYAQAQADYALGLLDRVA
jgi:mannose-1-phosphate guanylyltransferase